MVDLNNNTRRGQLSKKEAQSHRGGEGGRKRETKSDSGEEKTFGGCHGLRCGREGLKEGKWLGRGKEGHRRMKRAKKECLSVEAVEHDLRPQDGEGEREEETLNKNHSAELFPCRLFPRTSDLSVGPWTASTCTAMFR